ncbi:MAG: nascent polypeptide-associated complex protein [Candidatus Micrarchaeota archaeon]
MFPGMGNPAQMKQMLKQFGIKTDELKVKRVVFETDAKKIVFDSPQVTVMDTRGQKIYSVIGESREENAGVSQEDAELVASQAKVSSAVAKKALEESDGDIAQAIVKLKKE